MRIVMVGPGLMPIPPVGWGAIETVIWELSEALRKRGHEVVIANGGGLGTAVAARPWRADIVHCHYEPHLRIWLRLARLMRARLISTTHSPLAAAIEPERFTGSLRYLRRCDEHLALSESIANALRNAIPRARVAVVPNGVDVARFSRHDEANGAVICLGRWEARKRQQALWALASEHGIRCDFVGPGAEAQGLPADGAVRYLGAWTKDEVQRRLGRYSVLAVPSEGEAHSLVTLEALAAGVPVVVTPEAAGDLTAGSIGVTIAELGPAFAEALRASITSSQEPAFRRELAAHADRELSWASVAERYERAVAAIADP